jgi:hypothetical protein
VGQKLGFLGEVVAIAAAVRGEPPALDLDDALRDRVEEVPVVGDQDDRAGEIAGQELLEPGRGVGIEVIGRLVENGDVGARHQELRESDAPSLAAAALPARPVDVADPELVEKAQRFVASLPPAEAHDGVVERCLLL